MEHYNFNVIDLSVFGIFLVSGILAFRRGFVREVLSLATWVGASFVAAYAYPLAKPWVGQHIKHEIAADAATAVGLFCLALVVFIPICSLIANLIKGPTLTSIDRSIGFVFGLIRAFLILSLIYLCLSWIFPEHDEKNKQPAWLLEAKTKPMLSIGAEMLKSFVPEDTKKKVAEEAAKTKESTEKAIEDARRLEEISTPVPSTEKQKDKKSPSYGDDARNKMNELIEQKAKQ